MANNLRRSSGTLQTQRQKLPWPSDKVFKILSIDGGGIRGILPAAVLAEIESSLLNGKPSGNYFDLITGTSTGGIIALGLAMGLSANKILELYMSNGAEVFPALRWDLFSIREKLRYFHSIRHYLYDPAPLEKHVRSLFGSSVLGETQRRLCIPSFDGFTEVNVFKTPHHPDFKMDWKEELVTIAMATAAAPSYFPVYKNNDRYYADGGVWANNPIMVGLVDALSCYDVDRRNIQILSLGTGDTELLFGQKQILKGGLWHWRKIISSAMHLQSQNSLGQAGLLVGRDHILRLNSPSDPNNPIEMDDFLRAKAELPPIAKSLVNQFIERIGTDFFNQSTPEYKAYHGPRSKP